MLPHTTHIVRLTHKAKSCLMTSQGTCSLMKIRIVSGVPRYTIDYVPCPNFGPSANPTNNSQDKTILMKHAQNNHFRFQYNLPWVRSPPSTDVMFTKKTFSTWGPSLACSTIVIMAVCCESVNLTTPPEIST